MRPPRKKIDQPKPSIRTGPAFPYACFNDRVMRYANGPMRMRLELYVPSELKMGGIPQVTIDGVDVTSYLQSWDVTCGF